MLRYVEELSYGGMLILMMVVWVSHILISAILKKVSSDAYEVLNKELVDNANDVFFALFLLLAIYIGSNHWTILGYIVEFCLLIRVVSSAINLLASIPSIVLVFCGDRNERIMFLIALSNIVNAAFTIVFVMFAYVNLLKQIWPFA